MIVSRLTGGLLSPWIATLTSSLLFLAEAHALGTETNAPADEKPALAAIGGYRGDDARTWYLAMTARDETHGYPGLGYHRLPHEGDPGILEAQKPGLVRTVRVRALHFVRHGDFVWFTGHGAGTEVKLFGRSYLSSSDLAGGRCSWVVLAACSVVAAEGGSEGEEEGSADLTGTGVRWLTGSGSLHGVLGYNTGATWFGGSKRENVFAAEAFAGNLVDGLPIARAWMAANMDAANKFHKGDEGGKFGATSASAIVWDAYEEETLLSLERAKGASGPGGAAYFFLRRDESRTDSPWTIAALRGRPHRSESIGGTASIREYVVRPVSEDSPARGVRIRIDVTALADPGLISLDCRGSLEDLERNGIVMREGLRLRVYEDFPEGRLFGEGVVEKHNQHGWILRIDSKGARRESSSEPETEVK
jgi:hypothetical protein